MCCKPSAAPKDAEKPPHLPPATCPAAGMCRAGATLLSLRLAITAAFCVNPPGGVLQPELWCGLWRLDGQDQGTYDALWAVRVIT